MIETEYEKARERAAGRCEWVEGIAHHKTRCPEIHGEPAVNYKGTVILLPNIQKKKDVKSEDIKYYCFKHSNEMDKKKLAKKKKSKGKKKDKDQIDLLEAK